MKIEYLGYSWNILVAMCGGKSNTCTSNAPLKTKSFLISTLISEIKPVFRANWSRFIIEMSWTLEHMWTFSFYLVSDMRNKTKHFPTKFPTKNRKAWSMKLVGETELSEVAKFSNQIRNKKATLLPFFGMFGLWRF